MDAERRAARIVATEGWVVIEWRWGRDRDPMSVKRTGSRVATGVPDEVAVVVAGGELRGRAVLTVAPRLGMSWDGVASSHLPRSLPPPADRRGGRSGLVVRLREHPSGGSVGDLLAADGGLTAGGAVTVLAAVARGLSDLHRAGRGGVGLAPEDVGLRDDGCPVLTAVDRLRELDQRTVGEDVRAFAELAGVLCRAVAEERGDAVLAAATDRRHGSWEDVIAGVLRAADPTVVRAAGSGVAGASGRQVRGDPDADGGVTADGGLTADRGGRVDRRERAGRSAGGAPAGGHELFDVLERVLGLLADRPVARGLAAVRGWVAVRPKVVAVACSPLVTVAVLLMVVPGQDGAG